MLINYIYSPHKNLGGFFVTNLEGFGLSIVFIQVTGVKAYLARATLYTKRIRFSLFVGLIYFLTGVQLDRFSINSGLILLLFL